MRRRHAPLFHFTNDVVVVASSRMYALSSASYDSCNVPSHSVNGTTWFVVCYCSYSQTADLARPHLTDLQDMDHYRPRTIRQRETAYATRKVENFETLFMQRHPQ